MRAWCDQLIEHAVHYCTCTVFPSILDCQFCSLQFVVLAADMVRTDKLAAMLQERQSADVRQLNMVSISFCLWYNYT